MGLLDALKKDVQEVETNVEETQTPVVEESAQPNPAEEVKPTPDRSAYNCPTCKGEGLVVDTFEEGGFVRCPQCQGTGKV